MLCYVTLSVRLIELPPPAFSHFGHVPLDTESSSSLDSCSTAPSRHDVVTPSHHHQQPPQPQPPAPHPAAAALARRLSTDSQPPAADTTWLGHLRDENWILYPSATTVASLHRTQSAHRRSLGDLLYRH